MQRRFDSEGMGAHVWVCKGCKRRTLIGDLGLPPKYPLRIRLVGRTLVLLKVIAITIIYP